jgi:hypothetical protein
MLFITRYRLFIIIMKLINRKNIIRVLLGGITGNTLILRITLNY